MMSVPKGVPGLPKGARKGARCRRAVSLQDIYPTLLDLCGLPARGDIGGHSLAPLLGKPDVRWNHPAITSVFTGDLAVSWENWRYISYGDGGEELYNLENDPHEWKNLADDSGFTDIKKRMRAMLPKNPAAKVQRGSTP